MKSKDRSLSWTRTIYLVVALVLVSLALILLSTGRHLQPVESIAGNVFTPVQQAASDVTSTIGGWMEAVRRMNELEDENKRLRTALDSVTAENAALQELKRENDQLRAMLKFQAERPEINAIVANNIGGDPTGLMEVLTVDKGSSAGITEGLPVVSPAGILVGQVTAVSAERSTVRLITDTGSAIPVATQRTQTPGVLEGQWQIGGRLLMTRIPRDTDVKEQDVLLTSGLGGTFPKGLIAGQVSRVRQNDVQMEKEAEAIPLVDLNSLEYVLMVTNKDSKQP
jgi:rod shape-determining protein MreC